MKFKNQILLNEIQKGNKDVFNTIYHEYYSDLVRFAFGFIQELALSEDVVQSFFIDFWQKKNSLSIQSSLKAYLFNSIKNRCLNKLRDLKSQYKRNLIYLETMLTLNAEFENDNYKIIEEISLALNKLPVQMKNIFILKYFEGLKGREIADTLSISENTVNTQLKRGKQKLKELLLQSTPLNFIP